jgi:hypothetical protein
MLACCTPRYPSTPLHISDWYAPYADHQMADDGTNVMIDAPSP